MWILVVIIIAIIVGLVLYAEDRKEKEAEAAAAMKELKEQEHRKTMEKEAERQLQQRIQHYRSSPVMETIISKLIPYISKWTDKAKADVFVKGVVFRITCQSECVELTAESGLLLERSQDKNRYVGFNLIGYEDLSKDEIEFFAEALRDEMIQSCQQVDPRISVDPIRKEGDWSSQRYFIVDLSAIHPASLKKI